MPLGVPQDWQTPFLHMLEQQSLPALQAVPSRLQALHVRVKGWQPRPEQHLGGDRGDWEAGFTIPALYCSCAEGGRKATSSP